MLSLAYIYLGIVRKLRHVLSEELKSLRKSKYKNMWQMGGGGGGWKNCIFAWRNLRMPPYTFVHLKLTPSSNPFNI